MNKARSDTEIWVYNKESQYFWLPIVFVKQKTLENPCASLCAIGKEGRNGMTIPKPMACVIVQIINAEAKGEKSAISCCHVYYSGLGLVGKKDFTWVVAPLVVLMMWWQSLNTGSWDKHHYSWSSFLNLSGWHAQNSWVLPSHLLLEVLNECVRQQLEIDHAIWLLTLSPNIKNCINWRDQC